MNSRKLIPCAAVLLGAALSVGIEHLISVKAAARQPSFAIQSPSQYTDWVGTSLKRMETVKTGMTRAQLLKVFSTEGGLSTGSRRTYVYGECPLFKVDVEFEPVGRPGRDAGGRVTPIESDADVIKSISRPYLDWTVAD